MAAVTMPAAGVAAAVYDAATTVAVGDAAATGAAAAVTMAQEHGRALASALGTSLSSQLDRWEFFVLYLQYGIVFTVFLIVAGGLLFMMKWDLHLSYTVAARFLRKGGPVPATEAGTEPAKPTPKRVRALVGVSASDVRVPVCAPVHVFCCGQLRVVSLVWACGRGHAVRTGAPARTGTGWMTWQRTSTPAETAKVSTQ